MQIKAPASIASRSHIEALTSKDKPAADIIERLASSTCSSRYGQARTSKTEKKLITTIQMAKGGQNANEAMNNIRGRIQTLEAKLGDTARNQHNMQQQVSQMAKGSGQGSKK